jgi:hypothetical protein
MCTKLCKLLGAWFLGHQSAFSEFRDCILLLQFPRYRVHFLPHRVHLQAEPESW